jgi:hypothetical protein
MTAHEDDEPDGIRVGLVADPDFPHQVAQRLGASLPHVLADRFGSEPGWRVEVVCDPVTAGRCTSAELLQALAVTVRSRGWDYAVGVTDEPLRVDGRLVLADVSLRSDVAVVSLPALGGRRPFLRARHLVAQMVNEFAEHAQDIEHSAPRTDHRTLGEHRGHALRWLRMISPFRRLVPDSDDDADVRYWAPAVRGRVRLLSGMVRGNRPWRLLGGMSSALAAAMAASAYALISTAAWQISDSIGPLRMVVGTIWSIGLMTAWLIVAHRLWERRRGGRQHEQRLLYNASTLVTLGLGVCCLYLALFVVDAAAAGFLIGNGLLARILGHPVDVGSYLELAWGSASMGVVAGAVGSTLENDRSVRQAVYCYREERRRADRDRLERMSAGRHSDDQGG